jgi:hypothetical protein
MPHVHPLLLCETCPTNSQGATHIGAQGFSAISPGHPVAGTVAATKTLDAELWQQASRLRSETDLDGDDDGDEDEEAWAVYALLSE